MRLRQDLKLLRTQRLTATPELRQAIHILQMSAIELATYIQEQALQNPLLEIEDSGGEEQPEAAGPDSAAPESDSVGPEHVAEWAEYLGDAGDPAYAAPAGALPLDRQPEIETVPAAAVTLSEHLLLQLHVGLAASEVLPAAESIIEAIDEDGYLRVDLSDLGAATGLSPVMLRRALTVVQGLDPAGVGARDLKECLLLQLEARGLGSGLAARIVREHLDDLAASRLARIVTATGRDAAEVNAAGELVRSLDPRPGAAFDSAVRPRYVLPDVYVERVGAEYVIVLNDGAMPRLRISQFYRRMAAEAREQGAPAAAAEAAAFLGQRFRDATWLLRCLEQRRSTLYRVTESIMRCQVEFLNRGIRHMRPLTLADVAEDVGVHESTVSRAVAGKYVQTPRGAFELKFFFARGLSSSGGGQVSSTSVRRVMRELIDAEDPRRPHSDQRLVDLLAQRGAHLSRRTVTKYRLELGIPSSAQRRRY
ncbi:MAG: RNA polymerase factor sigma-54 [Bacillota bacterium]|nr:RNA polymerase factor sigma-54 [Bacillota bacterium]